MPQPAPSSSTLSPTGYLNLKLSSATFIGRLAVATLLINLFVVALAGYSIHQTRLRYQEQAEVTTRNLAQVLEAYIEGTLRRIDAALLATTDEAGQQLSAGGIDRDRLTAFLARQQGRLPEIDSLRVANARGIVSYGHAVVPDSTVDISDRNHFIRQRDGANAGIVVSEPIFARIDKTWVLPVSRRINAPDGGFAGIAYALIPLEHFSRLFSTLNVGKFGIVTLRGPDLGIVVRHPEPQGIGEVVGQKAAPAPLREMVQAGRGNGTYMALSTVDGIERTFSYRRIADHPLIIITGLATEDYLAGWRKDAIRISLLVALFILVTSTGAWLVYRSWKARADAAEALREQKEFLDTVLENEPECVKVLSPRGQLMQMNRAGLDMLEVASVAEARESGLLNLICPEYREAFLALSRRVLGGETGSLEFEVVGKRGTRRWLDTHATPLHGANGEVVALLGVTRDVSERKQAELRLRELNENLEEQVRTGVTRNMEHERLLIQQSRLAAMGEMIGNIAHQWRQPLNALGLLLANIQDSYTYKEMDQESLEKNVASGQRMIQKMSSTIDDFRNFFRPNKEKESFSLDRAVKNAMSLVEHSLANNAITVSIESGGDIRVYGFPNEFSQVLLNIVTNAKEAILERKKEGGTIEISWGCDEGVAWTRIRDNAGGIPDAIRPKIFDPYFTTKEKGTGIGLYMSKMIMDHMEGHIAASNSGEGAEFKLTLPRALPGT